MAQSDPHFKIRIPAALKARLEERAKADKRSLTAEIIDRLEKSFIPNAVYYSGEGIAKTESRLLDRKNAIKELKEEVEYLSKLVENSFLAKEDIKNLLVTAVENGDTGIRGLDMQFRNASMQHEDYQKRLAAAKDRLDNYLSPYRDLDDMR